MYKGLIGKISFFDKIQNQDVDIGYISNWSIDETSDVIEIPKLYGNYKIKKAGFQSWSASADGTVSFCTASNQKQLFAFKAERKEVKIKLYLSAEENTYFEGYGFIESLSVDLSADNKGNISISIAGNSHIYREAYKFASGILTEIQFIDDKAKVPVGFVAAQKNRYGLRLYLKNKLAHIVPLKINATDLMILEKYTLHNENLSQLFINRKILLLNTIVG